ncbi:Inosine triphosphate pyrophosphatase [Bienertia sinuspersici]
MNFQASSSRRRSLIPSWILDKPEFDDTVDVVTITKSSLALNIYVTKVFVIRRCRGYYVQFNELHQPIRKGGQLLVKLIGSIAKQECFCLVGELDWHHIDEDRFVIPDGEIYINTILSLYFKPQQRSQEEHYNAIPCGISHDNWRKLYMSECGKEARASQCHHISGGKSYANIRADYMFNMRKDGSFIEGTQAQDFLEDAKAKVDMLATTDGSKSRKELENEVFESLMYGGEPPKRPRGFGFGVVKSNIYGVHGLLRKEGHGKVHKRPLENENVNLTMAKNAELVKRNEVLEEKVNQNTMLMMSLLEATRNGKPSTELIDAAQSSLRIANPKVTL